MYFGVIELLLPVTIIVCFFSFICSVLDYLNVVVNERLKTFGKLNFQAIKINLQTTRNSIVARRFLSTCAFHRCITFHRQFRIVEIDANNAVSFTGPYAMGVLIILIVSTTHATIKMYGDFPLILYLPMPFYSIVLTTFGAILSPSFTGIHELSLQFLTSSKIVLARNKISSRKLRSERPLRINIGPFFPMKKATEATTFLFLVETTANSLIIVK